MNDDEVRYLKIKSFFYLPWFLTFCYFPHVNIWGVDILIIFGQFFGGPQGSHSWGSSKLAGWFTRETPHSKMDDN